MKKFLTIVIAVYSHLLHLFPPKYQKEYAEEMLLDFSDLAVDAARYGIRSLAFFCLRELMDFPVNLLRVHLQEGKLLPILRSQPARTGLRGALGFGIGFAAMTPIGWWISRWLYSAFDPLLQNYSIWYWENFQNERWIWLLDSLVRLLSFAFSGILFGLLFAVFAGRRSRYSRNVLVSALGLVIPFTTSYVLSRNFGWSYYLNATQSSILGLTISTLMGAFFAAIFGIAESDCQEPPRYLALGVFIYPLGTYLLIKLLFYLWLEITPWFFLCLIFWMTLLIGGVVALVMLINRKLLWMIAAGAAGHQLLLYAAFYITYYLLHLPSPAVGTGIALEEFTAYLINDAISQAVVGIIFGFGLGLIFGIQTKRESPQIAA